MFTSRDPSSGAIIQSFRSHSLTRVMRIVDRVAAAQVRWAATAPSERSACLVRLAGGLRAQRHALASTLTDEMGKRTAEALGEIDKCALVCDFYAVHGQAFLEPERVATDAGEGYVEYPPAGVVLAVMPWNFPLWQIVRCAVPALVAGNGVLVKPAASTPASALMLESLVAAAGFSPDLLRVILADERNLEPVIAHPAVAVVSLTGSERAGREVAQLAGRYLRRTVLELGGSDAFVVLADADVPAAVEAAVSARFLNCGQSCIAPKRLIVVPEVADAFIEGARRAIADLRTGDPRATETGLGPMASREARTRLHQQVRASVAAGARVLLGGKPLPGVGAYYAPTLLDRVTPGMPAFDDEVFGPVACVTSAVSESHALQLAAATRYGLGASVWSADVERAQRLARFMPVGMVAVNATVRSDPRMPFGGVRASGYGRELSYHGLREFTAPRSVWVR
ncbi:MAG: NAD-dependent succinate-semialdehyde dehydrogenase [Betaproteobacteria bacterium]|nr:NAD-dependent succinate-semialdehyde dehydrogenase [Betaproteobacteria bacterium]